MATRWFEADVARPEGVVQVAHGLNTKPEVMDDLIEVLLRQGFHCQRLSLHEEPPGRRTTPAAVLAAWRRSFAEASAEAVARCPSAPLCHVSFSIGALLAIEHLQAERAAHVRRMVLLAPPLALTRAASLVRLLAPLGRLGAVLPSAAPKDVRARRGTPLVEYAAMLSLIDQLQTLQRSEQLGQVPTLVLVDPRDELVRLSGVQAWIDRNGLPAWSLRAVEHRAPSGHRYRHLLVTEAALGSVAWEALTREVVGHLTSADGSER